MDTHDNDNFDPWTSLGLAAERVIKSLRYPRELSENGLGGRRISNTSRFRSTEVAERSNLSIDPQPGSKRAIRPEIDPLQTGGIVTIRIGRVQRMRSGPKVDDPIIGLVQICVVNLAMRPFAVIVKPSNPMSFVKEIVKTDYDVTKTVHRTSDFAAAVFSIRPPG